MVREIVLENKDQILIHRYNTLDDTYIQYYKPKGVPTVYKNIWAPKGDMETYKVKRLEAI